MAVVWGVSLLPRRAVARILSLLARPPWRWCGSCSLLAWPALTVVRVLSPVTRGVFLLGCLAVRGLSVLARAAVVAPMISPIAVRDNSIPSVVAPTVRVVLASQG